MHKILNHATGGATRIDVITPSLFRVRTSVNGEFGESGMNRYGLLKSDWPETEATVLDNEGEMRISTAAAELTIAEDGRIGLRNEAGDLLLSQDEPPSSDHERGFEAAFKLGDDRLYGMGDNDRDCIQRRGRKYKMIVRNVECYMPIPFLMSSRGWAILMNTTWYHDIDAGATEPNILRFSAKKGSLDYYLFIGDGLPDLLKGYIELTGKPAMLPRWAYGLTTVTDERGFRARDLLYEAHEFRRQGIPCDLIGLEPDWMETHYDFSTDKKWSEERFHIPFWLKGANHGTFNAALEKMGFKLSLWLCCDYDLFDYEESLIKARRENTEDEAVNSDEDLFKDPHFYPQYLDKITKPGVPWFEHLKKFVDDGARAFKLDGANQVSFHPDRKWKNGMDDAEAHNLYPAIYAKQMSQGYRDYTGKRSMIYTADGYVGIQAQAASWTGDTGGGPKPLTAILNLGMSGHSNVATDMQNWNEPGIHFGFFQPWSQLMCWHMYHQPWFQGEKLLEMFKFYANLRYRLLPYIYTAAAQANANGIPIARSMPLAFPDDPKSDALISQYMFGDCFLTAAFTDTIYLPKGDWIDYWTGEAFSGPKEMPINYPENCGGPLFVKSGAIIPMAPPMAYSDQNPLDTVILDIYPGNGENRFTLYEDDGESLAYENGAFAQTELIGRGERNRYELTVSPRQGEYLEMPPSRNYQLIFHAAKPQCITIDGQPTDTATWDAENNVIRLDIPDAASRGFSVLFCSEETCS